MRRCTIHGTENNCGPFPCGGVINEPPSEWLEPFADLVHTEQAEEEAAEEAAEEEAAAEVVEVEE